MFVYGLLMVNLIYDCFGGVNGLVYFVGGVGMMVFVKNEVVLVFVCVGVGVCFGLNMGYLKFILKLIWNLF